jgi:hypothetical protein
MNRCRLPQQSAAMPVVWRPFLPPRSGPAAPAAASSAGRQAVSAWYWGLKLYLITLAAVPAGGALERFRLIPVRANGQPAFGCYLRDLHAPVARAYGLMVLTLRGDRVAAITGFPDTSVFRCFGLPRTLRE